MKKQSYYGIPKVAKDGVRYRSTFEADFVNKFLYNKNILYEYEKNYPNSKCKCDFYLTDLELWVELVYHDVSVKYSYEKAGKKTYLPRATYYDNEYVKKFGAKFDWDKKKWYIIYTNKSFPSLEQFMDDEAKEMTLHSHGKAICRDYDKKLVKKIGLAQSLIIVTHEDMKRSNLQNIIISKNSKSCFAKITSKYFENLYSRSSVGRASGS